LTEIDGYLLGGDVMGNIRLVASVPHLERHPTERPTNMGPGASSRNMFQVVLFGGPELLVEGEICPLSPRQAGFLGFLYACERQAVGREEIISLFWPGVDPGRARRNLNQLLYTIKRKTGAPAPFESTRDLVLPQSVGTESDLERYRGYLHEGRLEKCAEMVSLGFLRVVAERLSKPLSDWIEGQERKIRSQLIQKLKERLGNAEKGADWHAAQEGAVALSMLDPLSEAILRSLMRACSRTGGPAAAEAVFIAFSSRYKDFWGTQWRPKDETRTVLEAIRAEAASNPPPSAQSARLEPGNTRLVGRNPERHLLRQTLTNPPVRALRGILVLGEAGIGKTRLIHETISGLRLEGQVVFVAEQAELEQLIPLNPLIEALSRSEVGDTLSALEDPWRAVLYGVMPSHFRGEGPIPQAPQIQPGSVPRRLFEAIHQLLLALVAEAPTIVVLEDLQWADETTLSVLEFLFKRWDQGRLQLVFSLRSEEVRNSSPLKSFIETLRVQEGFLEVPLADLSKDESQALMQDVSGRPLEANEMEHLQALAGGNPFFLIELTYEYLAGRVDRPSLSQRLIAIPLSIRQVLERRLSQLYPPAETVLGALSVHSRAMTIAELARIARISIPECLRGMDQLHQARLVKSEGVKVTIGHELIRHTVYQGLPASSRAWLHESLGTYLQAASGDALSDELAIHFHFAGVSAKALRFAMEAANRAEASGAIPEALRFLGIAREHTDDPQEVAGIIWRMGKLNYLRRNLEEAAPLLEVAAQRFRRQGLRAEALEAEVKGVDCLGQTDRLPPRDCDEELERIKQEAKEGGHWVTFMEALDVEIHLFDRLGNADGAQRVLKEAEGYAARGNEEAQSHAHSVLALKVCFGDAEEGLHAARQAVRAAGKTRNAALELRALNRLIVVLLYQGQLHTKEGLDALKAAEERFALTGDLIQKIWVRLNKVVWHLDVGELDRASMAIPAVEELIRGTQARDPRAMFFLNKGELEFQLDRFEDASSSFSQALEVLPKSSPWFHRTIISSGLGLCALREGDVSEAKRLESELPDLPKQWTFDPSVVASFKTEMLRMRGDLDSADQFLEEIAEGVRNRFVTAWIKVNILRAKILRLTRPRERERVVRETLEKARALGLKVRALELERLLKRTTI
jgi:DNA-binding SARP family transcriptional activator/tetratricopeptide (TPR) repeat protein